jgi:murein DD-endopeptidase MepM/ murein hydrolase activator NlpD
VTLRSLTMVLLVRAASGALLLTLSGCGAAAHPRLPSENPSEPSAGREADRAGDKKSAPVQASAQPTRAPGTAAAEPVRESEKAAAPEQASAQPDRALDKVSSGRPPAPALDKVSAVGEPDRALAKASAAGDPDRGLDKTQLAHAPVAGRSAAGVYHRVERGQNLYRIAKGYGVSMETVRRANGLVDIHVVRAGQVLFVPGGIEPDDRPGSSRPRRSGPKSDRMEPLGPNDARVGVSFSAEPPTEPFSWPVAGGDVRSAFGIRRGRLHAGIDIAAPAGTDVIAARGGRVIYSGHRFQGYGNVVMIEHDDGYVTVYAHNSKNLVGEGDTVSRGQTVARVGATGNATGSHCHFEVRHGRVAVDPAPYWRTSADESPAVALAEATAPPPLPTQ